MEAGRNEGKQEKGECIASSGPSLLHAEVLCPLFFCTPTDSGSLLAVDMAPQSPISKRSKEKTLEEKKVMVYNRNSNRKKKCGKRMEKECKTAGTS